MNQAHNAPWPVVLTIAGFDPSGGAGVVADIKTFAAHHCYGVSAITALTVQNTLGVAAVYPVAPHILKESIESLFADGQVKALKIGMLGNAGAAEVVRDILDAHPGLPSVLDPVVRSSTEAELLDPAGLAFLREHLLSRVSVVTPNLAEAAALTELPVDNPESMKAAAHKLVERGARAVVVTGGHLDKAIDILFDGKDLETFAGDRIKPDNTHGTGCTFSSAVAANLALGRHLRESVVLAKAFVAEAIRNAFPAGPGRHPLHHFYRIAQIPRTSEHVPASEALP